MPRIRVFTSLALAFGVFLASPLLRGEAKTLKLDPGKSRIQIHVKAGGVFGSHPHTMETAQVSGQVLFDAEQIERSSLSLKIRSDSLTVVNEESQKDKAKIEKDMREKVLEISKYPEIAFTSTKVVAKKVDAETYDMEIVGDLNLHGVTKSVTLKVKAAFRDSRLSAKGDGELKQTDYGIKPFSAVGGALQVKDEVGLSWDLTAL